MIFHFRAKQVKSRYKKKKYSFGRAEQAADWINGRAHSYIHVHILYVELLLELKSNASYTYNDALVTKKCKSQKSDALGNKKMYITKIMSICVHRNRRELQVILDTSSK